MNIMQISHLINRAHVTNFMPESIGCPYAHVPRGLTGPGGARNHCDNQKGAGK
jgi:hypothetical protein